MDSHDRKPQTGPVGGSQSPSTNMLRMYTKPCPFLSIRIHKMHKTSSDFGGSKVKWKFPEMGLYTPKWIAKDNPIKMDDEQGYPHFRKPPTGTTGKTGQHYILLNYGWSQIPFPSPGLREIPVADWNMSRLIYIYIYTHTLGAS